MMPESLTDSGHRIMSQEAIAIAAGLQRAWDDHRADVEAAILAAARLRTAFQRPAAPEAEPIPAYAAPPRTPGGAAEDTR